MNASTFGLEWGRFLLPSLIGGRQTNCQVLHPVGYSHPFHLLSPSPLPRTPPLSSPHDGIGFSPPATVERVASLCSPSGSCPTRVPQCPKRVVSPYRSWRIGSRGFRLERQYMEKLTAALIAAQPFARVAAQPRSCAPGSGELVRSAGNERFVLPRPHSLSSGSLCI